MLQDKQAGTRGIHLTIEHGIMKKISALLIILTGLSIPVVAQDDVDKDLRMLLGAIEQLSAATAPGGGGAQAYAPLLAENYSRWTLGSTVLNSKSTWVDGIHEWFSEGWRVVDRNVDNVEIKIQGDLAFARRLVEETYLGPDGSRTSSRSAIAEVWTRDEDGTTWKLLRVDLHPLDAAD